MHYSKLSIALLIALILLSVGCSSSMDNPTSIPLYEESTSDYAPLPVVGNDDSGRNLMGMWTVDFDLSSHDTSIYPNREISAHFNVTSLLPAPVIVVNSYDPITSVIDVDVTISNPFDIDAYDLRMIVFENAGHNLLNSDAWTDLYDISGGLPINPFKAYAQDVFRHKFAAYAEHTENILIYLPNGNPNVTFAIDASYPTNCEEPRAITDFSQTGLYQRVNSEATLGIRVFDWQRDVDSVALYCPEVTDTVLEYFTQVNLFRWEMTLANKTGALPGDYFGVIVAYSSGNALYQVVNIHVSENTIGLIQNDEGAFDGYTLFAPIYSTTTYLIDMNGCVVNSWESDYKPGCVVYLLDNGNILRTGNTFIGPGGSGGIIEEKDWDDNLVWEFEFAPDTYLPHHDIERLSNGNTLIIAWEIQSNQEAIDAGRNPQQLDNELWTNTIIEINPAGDIVWEWHVWDHLSSVNGGIANGEPVSMDIADPGKMNINVMMDSKKDWMHINAIGYNPNLDQIVISSRHMSEIYIIDHSTCDYSDPQAGIEEARGPAGDFLYRWGNPQNYCAGDESNRKFFMQHNSHWIEPGYPGAGNIMVFNNGMGRHGGNYSSIDEITTPVDAYGNYSLIPGSAYGPPEQSWIYTSDNPTDFYSSFISGAQRLSNGNTLICTGASGWFFEITDENEIVWQYINPVTLGGPQPQGSTLMENSNLVFRCYRYAPDYPAFDGRDMTPGEPIEL